MTYPAEHPTAALAAAGLDADELSGLSGLAVVAIAGRDSLAAAVAAVRERGLTTLLPTSVATGTEYGDETAPGQATDRLRRLLGDGARVLPHIRIGSPKLWAALNGRFATAIADRYRVCSPCLACHLYVHLARVPLARALGGVPIVSGERESHGGRLKLSQLPLGIDAETRILARAGIELIEPLRKVTDGAEIARIVGDAWPADAAELRCLHSGNYAAIDGSVTLDELAYARYVHGFFEPVGTAIVDAWRDAPEPDYEAIVREILAGPDAA